MSDVSKAGLGLTNAVKLSVSRTRRTKPSPAHRHETAQQSLTSPCDRQDGRRKHSLVLYHSPPYPRRRRTGSLPGPFTLFFFMLCMQKRKSRNLAPQVLTASKLSIVPSERHALKDINIGTYYFVLQRTPSCPPSPSSPLHSDFWDFSAPIVVFINDTRMDSASFSKQLLNSTETDLFS